MRHTSPMMQMPRPADIAVPPAPTFCQKGFTLTEMAVVLVIVALLVGGMMMPLSAQQDARNAGIARQSLQTVEEALLGFLVANDRLPCPATADSLGQEKFASDGSAANGKCETFTSGFLPAVNLGITPTDDQGFALDAWNNRIRYVVFSGTINNVENPFTRTEGIKSATMSLFYGADAMLVVCPSATGLDTCVAGTTTNLTRKAPAITFSTGKNGPLGTKGADEAENLDGDNHFVMHDISPASAANGEFDDIVKWLSGNLMLNRLVAAGKLP